MKIIFNKSYTITQWIFIGTGVVFIIPTIIAAVIFLMFWLMLQLN